MRYLPEYGLNLTQQLALERAEIIYNITKSQRQLGMLFEATNRREKLDRKIELMQLNEILYHQNLYSRIMGEDLYSRVVRRTIEELREQGLVEEGSVLLTEGFWDSVQSGIGNFAGGADKVLKKLKLKKEPKGWEEAQRVFQKIAKEEGNQVIQDLVKAIEDDIKGQESGAGSKSKDQVFPVNKSRGLFFSGVNTIASTYDTLVAAAAKAPGEEGHMPVELVNEIIRQLRIITQKYMADTEREKGGMYASFGGGDAKEAAEMSEGAHLPLPLLIEQDKAKEGEEAGEDPEKMDVDAEWEQMMGGQKSQVYTRMTSLKAPLVIAGVGAALGALGWIAYQPWFHDWVAEILDISKNTTSEVQGADWTGNVEEALGEANPELNDLGQIEAGGGGLAKQVSRLLGLGEGENLLGKDASLEDLKQAALKVGGGDLDKGLKGIAGLTDGRGKPGEAYEWMKKAIGDPSAVGADSVEGEGSLWKLFAGGTDRAGGVAAHAMPDGGIFSVGIGNNLKQLIVKQAMKQIKKQVYKAGAATVTTTAAGYLGMSTMLAAAAPVLAGIGLSTVVAGASLAAIRQRAKTASRMGTLNALLQTLNDVTPPEVEGVTPEPEERSKVTITLYDPEEAAVEEEATPKAEGWRRHLPLLVERTEVEISGLTGDPELEATGGVAQFMLQAVDSAVPPQVDSLDQIPFVVQGIQEKLPDLDLAAKNVDIVIIDKRTKEEIPEKPEDPHPAPVHEEDPEGDPVAPGSPFSPAQVAKGEHAIVVFDPDNARVWRILKKVTFKKYASDAKRSKDKTAPELADRAARYDSILSALKADGVFVNSDEIEAELSKISSGEDGKPYRVVYHRTRKNKKGEVKKRKSSTGGFTDAGDVSAIGDIRKNIKGAPGARPPKNQGAMTVIYLVGDDVLRALQDAGLEEDEAKTLANNAIAAWSKAGKKPKLADLGIDDEAKGADVLKAASLAEVYDFTPRHRYAVVGVTPKFFRRVIREVRETRSSAFRASRVTHLAGLDLLDEDKSGKGACPDTGCIKKSGDKWRIISNKTGKMWPQKYETKEKAENALKAYHVHN